MHPADQGKTGAVAEGVALAANDDHGPPLPGGAEEIGVTAPDGPVSGWDPFEVWRTRVRDARRVPVQPADG
jgi:hypothetical protein